MHVGQVGVGSVRQWMEGTAEEVPVPRKMSSVGVGEGGNGGVGDMLGDVVVEVRMRLEVKRGYM